jgi:hypothetical protein
VREANDGRTPDSPKRRLRNSLDPTRVCSGSWLPENSEIEFANGNFVSTSIDLKNKSASDSCQEATSQGLVKEAARQPHFFAEDQHPAPVPCYCPALDKSEPSVPMWLILQLASVASMPAVYMARYRGRSATAWLNMALIFRPLVLVALLLLGKRNREAIHAVP